MRNKIVCVIGASSGIGFEIAKKLILIEDNCVIAGSRKSEDIFLSGCDKLDIDVTIESSVMSFFDYIDEKYGDLDIIINCAGFVLPYNLLETTLDNWEKTIKTNLTGTFLTNKYASKILKRRGGKIINIASTAGLTPRPGWAAYAASKSGVINFSKAISEELKNYGIKVFIVCPGRTATPLRKILAPTEDPKTIMQPETVANLLQLIIDGRLDTMEGQPLLIRERF